MISFQCLQCLAEMVVDDADAGTTTQCRACHRIQQAPAENQFFRIPIPDKTVADTIIGNLRGIVAAVALIATIALGFFSVWAEWGPWAWIAAVQIAAVDEYSYIVTLGLTFFVFFTPSVLLYGVVDERRASRIFFGASMSIAGITLLAAIAYYMITGDPAVHRTSLLEAAASATYLPHPLTITASSLSRLTVGPAYGIKVRKKHWEFIYTEIHLPKDPTRPSVVYIAAAKGSLEDHLRNGKAVSGTIRYMSLPYLVRRVSPPDTPLFALVFKKDESVRSFWQLPLLLVCLGAGLLWRYRLEHPTG